MTGADLLPLDLPTGRRPVLLEALALIACSTCGSPDWWRCAPGTASTAELYPASNIVALRDDDGEPAVAYCQACDPLVVRS